LESPGGWAHRVGINLARSQRRRRRAGRRAAERLSRHVADPGEVDPADRLAIREAVAALPERQRRALVLRYYADLPVPDVADAMGIPTGTVKTLTRAAIAALRAACLLDGDEAEMEPTDVT
ncbi:MAG: sigma-70 family RNA polymerase sigma factor, partial [Acidimicrobiia bacterium]